MLPVGRGTTPHRRHGVYRRHRLERPAALYLR
jgi:hypothetical protein